VLRTLPLLGLAGVLILAGCGGGKGTGTTTTTAAAPKPTKPAQQLGKAAYVARMQKLGKQLDLDLHRIYPLAYRAGGSAGSKDTLSSLEAARRAVLGIEVDLEEIGPPAPIAADHRQLEAGLQSVADQIGRLVDALKTGDPDTFARLSSLPSLVQVQKATRAMEDKGYDVIRDSG
jgi:hypothetical protein